MLFDHGVHRFVATQNRVGWAHWQAKRAANAPGLVNHGHSSGRFQAVSWVQVDSWLPNNSCQSGDARSPAWGALIDCCGILGNRIRVGCAVRVTAACALGLRQRCVDTGGKRCLLRVCHPFVVLFYLLRTALTGARLTAAFAIGLAIFFVTGLLTDLATGFS